MKNTKWRLNADFRIQSIAPLLNTLSDSISELDANYVRPSWADDDSDIIEHINGLCGLVFVVAQTYIAGTIADAQNVAPGQPQTKKDYLIEQFGEQYKDTGFTNIQIFDALANHYKHHDEWLPNSNDKHVVRTQSRVEVLDVSEFHLLTYSQAIEKLWPETGTNTFKPLLRELANWRERLAQAIKALR